MTEYLVVWKIDIDAESPEKAAEEALRIHRDPQSLATVFEVTDPATDETTRVDADIAGTFVMRGTQTGRLPSDKPNITNGPKDKRRT